MNLRPYRHSILSNLIEICGLWDIEVGRAFIVNNEIRQASDNDCFRVPTAGIFSKAVLTNTNETISTDVVADIANLLISRVCIDKTGLHDN